MNTTPAEQALGPSARRGPSSAEHALGEAASATLDLSTEPPSPADRVHPWWIDHARRLTADPITDDIFDNFVVREEMLEVFPKRAERGQTKPPDFLRECVTLMGAAWLDAKLGDYVDPVRSSDEALSEKTASQLYYLARLELLCAEGTLGDIVEVGAGFGNRN